MHYTGSLEDGKIFDSSRTEGREPISFKLGANKVCVCVCVIVIVCVYCCLLFVCLFVCLLVAVYELHKSKQNPHMYVFFFLLLLLWVFLFYKFFQYGLFAHFPSHINIKGDSRLGEGHAGSLRGREAQADHPLGVGVSSFWCGM